MARNQYRWVRARCAWGRPIAYSLRLTPSKSGAGPRSTVPSLLYHPKGNSSRGARGSKFRRPDLKARIITRAFSCHRRALVAAAHLQFVAYQSYHAVSTQSEYKPRSTLRQAGLSLCQSAGPRNSDLTPYYHATPRKLAHDRSRHHTARRGRFHSTSRQISTREPDPLCLASLCCF